MSEHEEFNELKEQLDKIVLDGKDEFQAQSERIDRIEDFLQKDKEAIEKLESFLPPQNHLSEEEKIRESYPDEWLKPREEKPTIIPPHEHIWLNNECVHCNLTIKEFDEKTKAKDSGPRKTWVDFGSNPKESDFNLNKFSTRNAHIIIPQLQKEIERLKRHYSPTETEYVTNLDTIMNLQHKLSAAKEIIERALDYIHIHIGDMYPELNEILEGKS